VSTAPPDSLLGGSKVLITVAVMGAALMAVLDISIVNVALSDIRASFGTPIDQIAWVSTGYMMANIVVIPMTGWLQRKFGFRRYFTVSIIIFTIASALCGLAWDLPSLVAFRALQGLGGGAIIPTAQAILFARYPREEHGMAGALFALGAITGPLLGPTVGGYLIDLSSWHWIFLINVPVGIVVAFLAWRSIEQPGHQDPRERIDRWGIALLAVGMASLQYVLEEGNREGWDEPIIVGLLVLAVVALVTFIVHELETPHPVVDLRVFKNRSYTAASGLNFLIGTALFSGGLLYSLYCGTVMHYSALDIGLLFLKGSAIQILLLPIIGKFANRVDGRYFIAWGVVMLCFSIYTNAQLANTMSQGQLIMPVLIRSLGLGFVFVPLSVVALSDLPPQQRGNAAGLFNLTRELGGSIGTAFMASMLSRHTAQQTSVLAEHVSRYDTTTLTQLGAMRGVFGSETAALAVMQGRITVQAMVRAFNEGYYMLLALFALAFLLILLMKRASGPAPAAAH
jgi:MFS transporter, DHA2 family, multidrug resistance protein